MSSLALPATLEVRLRAIRTRRRASRFAGVLKVGMWSVGIAAAASMAGAALIGGR
ncbi:MAG TPA: hypothetical protein VLU92_08285 [Candidatus Dormibacteraeota bacterium]|nr:hypothetical protein [Candidatus Dormibacteraeota bacterium]